MITITGRRDIAGATVFRDDIDPLTVYVLPSEPRVAGDETGTPELALIWYRRDVAKLTDDERKTKLGGGILSVTVELSATDDQEKQIRAGVAADPELHRWLETGHPLPSSTTDDPAASAEPPTPGAAQLRQWWLQEIKKDEAKLAKALKLSNVPVRDGTVSIALLAESPEPGKAGEFVSSLVGVGRVSAAGTERASFMAKLTQDGAVAMWDALENDLSVIHVAYDLKFDYRIEGVRMVVWCDVEKAYHAIQNQWQTLNDDARWTDSGGWHTFSRDRSNDVGSALRTVTSSREISGIDVIPTAGPDTVKPELIADMIKRGEDMLKDFLEATFVSAKPGEGAKFDDDATLQSALPAIDGKPYGHDGIRNTHLRRRDEVVTGDLHVDIKTKAIDEYHPSVNANLGHVLEGRDVSRFRTKIELDDAWYRYLNLQILCTADFDRDPVDLVQVHVAYSGSGPQGKVDTAKDFVFRKDTPPQFFATYLAAPDQTTYSYDIAVFYKQSAATYRISGRSDTSVLVLDTDALGVLHVDVQAGLVDWDQIRQIFVKLWYGSGGDRRETQIILDPKQQIAPWVEAIGKPVTGPYSYVATFVDKNDQRQELPEASATTRKLILNQPVVDDLEVALVPAGTFAPTGILTQILVAVRYRDDANNYAVNDIFTLIKEGDTKIWKVPLMNKKLRRFDYKVTVFYTDGVVREDDWKTTDGAIVPVGDQFGWRVQVLPYLLKGGAYLFGTLQLTYDDAAAGIHAEKTLELNDFTKPLVWRFRMGAPDRHTFSYQLTLYDATGKPRVVAPAQESKEVLVLLPPPPP